MTLESWLLYVTTVLLLMSTPGPSQLLMLSNSASHGFRKSLATACGDLTANLLQMLAAGFGLAAIIATYGHALTIIKWLGVVYLFWLGIKMMRNAGRNETENPSSDRTVSPKTLWVQGFITSAANPKAVVFFAALFPQFIDPNLPFSTQFVILSATYIMIDGAFLSVYGIGASSVAQKLKSSGQGQIERIGGGIMISAAILLGFKSVGDR